MAAITLYKNNSKYLVANKSLTTIASLSGNFRDAANLITPTVTVDVSEVSGADGADYAYVAEFGRYYYITGQRWLTTKLLELELEVDLRKTCYAALQTQKGIVSRQENNYDMYLPDNLIPSSIKRNTSIMQWINTPFTTGNTPTTVLITLGGK